MKHLLITFICLCLLGCKEKVDYTDQLKDIPFLYELKGTKNYEVKKMEGFHDVWFDSIQQVYITHNEKTYYDYKLAPNDDVVDSMSKIMVKGRDTLYINNDYTTTAGDYYTRWLETGDRTLYEYIEVFPYEEFEERDSAQYMQKHLELYEKATEVHYYYYYYYYIDGRWHRMNPFGVSNYLKEAYPEKHTLAVHREGACPYIIPPKYSKAIYYPTQHHEVHSGGVSGTFSTGMWVIKTGLPGGDTLTYKKYGDGIGPEAGICEMPKRFGGNDSVFFISSAASAIPKEFTREQEKAYIKKHSGLYLVRPRKKKQP